MAAQALRLAVSLGSFQADREHLETVRHDAGRRAATLDLALRASGLQQAGSPSARDGGDFREADFRNVLASAAWPTRSPDVNVADKFGKRFSDDAPINAAEAATIILDGVEAERWRILVGKAAEFLDERVRAAPDQAYNAAFCETFRKRAQAGEFPS
jgi:hypothetical protein